jgi:hypothetical protein
MRGHLDVLFGAMEYVAGVEVMYSCPRRDEESGSSVALRSALSLSSPPSPAIALAAIVN